MHRFFHGNLDKQKDGDYAIIEKHGLEKKINRSIDHHLYVLVEYMPVDTCYSLFLLKNICQ